MDHMPEKYLILKATWRNGQVAWDILRVTSTLEDAQRLFSELAPEYTDQPGTPEFSRSVYLETLSSLQADGGGWRLKQLKRDPLFPR